MTIDSSQGKECDISIISLVRNIPTSFLNEKRTNVMLSRAKYKNIIVCNKSGLYKIKNKKVQNIFQELVNL